MSTSIEEKDLIQEIKDLKQRISDLERQQRTIGTNLGNVFLETNQLRIGTYDVPFQDNITIQSDVISLGTQNNSGTITGTIELNWDAWATNQVSLSGNIDKFIMGGSKMVITFPHTPPTSTSVGEQGTICWDTSYLYVCIDDNLWRRIALSSF